MNCTACDATGAAAQALYDRSSMWCVPSEEVDDFVAQRRQPSD